MVLNLDFVLGFLCGSWNPSFLPHLIFNSHSFSRRVTSWWHSVHPPPFFAGGGGGLNLQPSFQDGGA